MAELLKYLYNKDLINKLGRAFKDEYPLFDTEIFEALVFDKDWDNRELKQRMRHITSCLHEMLPDDYLQTLEILTRVAPGFNGFAAILFPDYVELYGLDHFDESLKALGFFTQFSSSEFAIRPFIIKQPKKMMQQMLQWSTHSNHHVRRLASEGCRPRLPWAIALQDFKKDPSLILPILENLKEDESEYVRRSVANNLNDIAKDNPEIVLEITRRWKGKNPLTDKIVKHASRSLLKKGVTEALSNFDFLPPNNINVTKLEISLKSISIGDDFVFSFQLANSAAAPVKLRIEYGIYYMKANGKWSRKIFQLTENTFLPNKTYQFKKKQSFKELTTRKHYAGEHKLVIIVNGRELADITFELTLKASEILV
jgi:3-methyladenine DNA glycosylase AlkC